MSTPKLWDIAAGVVIAEAAGAVITDWNGDRIFPVDLDAYAGQPFRVLAGNPRAHAGLLETMRR
jgi:fructose-1,6-bisphosphatase/inositol monophosphatase family enzyme